jgi:hypothetical protein
MNPYLNSINGWGGGFIAFWPSQGVVAPTVSPKHRGFTRNVGRLLKALAPLAWLAEFAKLLN